MSAALVAVVALASPAILVVGMGLISVWRRSSGKWHVHAPNRAKNGIWNVVGKAHLMRGYAERDRG